MSILTLILFAVLVLGLRLFIKTAKTSEVIKIEELELIRQVGILGLVIGVFGQLIGLFNMFKAVEEIGQVAPAMLAGGLKVSAITTLYGLIILIISLIFYLILRFQVTSRKA